MQYLKIIKENSILGPADIESKTYSIKNWPQTNTRHSVSTSLFMLNFTYMGHRYSDCATVLVTKYKPGASLYIMQCF